MKTTHRCGLESPHSGDEAARPFILVNMAMTVDGKIATANRRLSSFGSASDKHHLLSLRATADAVMAGARTVDLNSVNLGPGPARFRRVRLRRHLREYNLRIIVSGRATLKARAIVFRHRFSEIIVLTTRQAQPQAIQRLRKAGAIVRVCGAREIEWKATLRWLRERWGVSRLLCEGGGELNEALFRAGVVDELHLTICPFIFGGKEAPTIVDGRGAGRLSGAWPLRLRSARRRGDELFLVYGRG
jgi:riboflavin-specific deaminase-like protein